MIGDSIPRYDGIDHVTGTTCFVDDIHIFGMLHVKALLSPHPNAKIIKISVDEALKVPGVHMVITSKDIPKNRYGVADDHHVFADRYVRYVGQLIAAVVAEDEATAEMAVGLINVKYEPLKPVFDPFEAMREDAPQIRRHGNIWKFGSSDKRVVRVGDVEKGFREADLIFEDNFTTPVHAHAFLETHVGVATFDERSRLLVYTTGQSLHWVHPSLADVLQIPMERIRMVGGIVGGGFGGKSDLSVEPVIAVAALKTGRPVKWRWTMHEELRLPTVRGAFHLQYKTGIRKDGQITAQHIKSIQDLGAFCYRGSRITDRQGTVASGPYRVPNYWYDGYAVHTNKVPAAALRGFGVAQVNFASEVHMSNIAQSIEMDPIEFRRINALRDGDIGFRGSVLERTGAIECLAAIEAVHHEKKDYPAEKHLKRGSGVALTVMPIGLTAGVPPVSVNVYITPEGTLVLSVNIPDLGQGSRTTLTQIASQALGISENRISVSRADSSLNPRGAGPGASQETYITGNAVKHAVEKIKRICLEVAAAHLKCRLEDLEMKGGRIYLIANRDISITLSELSAIAAEQGKVLMATGTYKTETILPDENTGLGKPYEEYGYAAAYAQVLVDTETGRVKVERLASAADAGRAINPMAVEGQIEGGAAMNLGQALMEELYPGYPSDRFLTSGLHEYLIPTSCDMPPIESIIIEKESVKGPYGAKGIGEVTATAIAPAIANAIGAAVGMAPTQLPITSERLFYLLKKKKPPRRSAK